MAFILSTIARDAACDGIVDLLDGGFIRIYDGTQATNPQTALSGQTLLASCIFGTPAFGASGASVDGRADSNAITSDTNVDATGTASWARVLDSGGVDVTDAVFDMDIGQGSGTLSFDNTSFVAGGTAAISSIQITVPAS